MGTGERIATLWQVTDYKCAVRAGDPHPFDAGVAFTLQGNGRPAKGFILQIPDLPPDLPGSGLGKSRVAEGHCKDK